MNNNNSNKYDTLTHKFCCSRSCNKHTICCGLSTDPHLSYIILRQDSCSLSTIQTVPECFWVSHGVDFIFGNKIAGGKVYPSPEAVDNPIAESKHDDLVQRNPDMFSVSVLSSAQARKQAQDVDLSDSVFASALSEDRLPPRG